MRAYKASDYAGLETKKYDFYFGYEVMECAKHKDPDVCEAADCEKREWCFTAHEKSGKKKTLVLKARESELKGKENNDPEYYLLLGIGLFLDICGKL